VHSRACDAEESPCQGFEEAVFSLRLKRDHQEEWHHVTSPSLAPATRSAPDFGSHRCFCPQAARRGRPQEQAKVSKVSWTTDDDPEESGWPILLYSLPLLVPGFGLRQKMVESSQGSLRWAKHVLIDRVVLSAVDD